MLCSQGRGKEAQAYLRTDIIRKRGGLKWEGRACAAKKERVKREK